MASDGRLAPDGEPAFIVEAPGSISVSSVQSNAQAVEKLAQFERDISAKRGQHGTEGQFRRFYAELCMMATTSLGGIEGEQYSIAATLLDIVNYIATVANPEGTIAKETNVRKCTEASKAVIAFFKKQYLKPEDWFSSEFQPMLAACSNTRDSSIEIDELSDLEGGAGKTNSFTGNGNVVESGIEVPETVSPPKITMRDFIDAIEAVLPIAIAQHQAYDARKTAAEGGKAL